MATRNAEPPSGQKAVFLIGMAGSGKTSVAARLVTDDCPLFQIDDYYRKTTRAESGREWSTDEGYRKRAYGAMARDVLRALKHGKSVIIETTGASSRTVSLFERLARRRGLTRLVILVRISRERARARIRARNRSAYPVKCPVAFVDLAASALKRSTLPIDFIVNGNGSRRSVLQEVDSIVRSLRQ